MTTTCSSEVGSPEACQRPHGFIPMHISYLKYHMTVVHDRQQEAV